MLLSIHAWSICAWNWAHYFYSSSHSHNRHMVTCSISRLCYFLGWQIKAWISNQVRSISFVNKHLSVQCSKTNWSKHSFFHKHVALEEKLWFIKVDSRWRSCLCSMRLSTSAQEINRQTWAYEATKPFRSFSLNTTNRTRHTSVQRESNLQVKTKGGQEHVGWKHAKSMAMVTKTWKPCETSDREVCCLVCVKHTP